MLGNAIDVLRQNSNVTDSLAAVTVIVLVLRGSFDEFSVVGVPYNLRSPVARFTSARKICSSGRIRYVAKCSSTISLREAKTLWLKMERRAAFHQVPTQKKDALTCTDILLGGNRSRELVRSL